MRVLALLALVPALALAQAPVNSIAVAPSGACSPTESGRVWLHRDTGVRYCCSGGTPTWAACDSAHTHTAAQSGVPYEIVGYLPGKPASGATVLAFKTTQTVSFPADLAGSYVSMGVVPAATATYTLNRCVPGVGCASIGTAAISTAGAATFTVSATTFNPGDSFYITAPNPADASLADVAFSIKGSRN